MWVYLGKSEAESDWSLNFLLTALFNLYNKKQHCYVYKINEFPVPLSNPALDITHEDTAAFRYLAGRQLGMVCR